MFARGFLCNLELTKLCVKNCNFMCCQIGNNHNFLQKTNTATNHYFDSDKCK